MKFIRSYVLPGEGSINPFGVLNQFTWKFHGLDWTKTLNQFSIYDIDDSILKNPFLCDNSFIEFSECMDIVSKKYIEKYNNIGILWSGGLDSTSLISAFLKNKLNPKNLFVYLTTDSISEYPWMFEHLKSIGSNLIFFKWEEFYSFDFSQCDCLLSGNGIGGFWYTDSKYNKIYEDLKNYEWKKGIIEQYKRQGINVEKFIPYFEEMCSKVNTKFNSFLEFQKICTLVMGRICFSFFPSVIKTTNALSFFEDPLFFRFFLQYVPTYKEALNLPYKFPMRKYILEYTKDEDYFKNKGKVNSCKLQHWEESDVLKYNFPILVETKDENYFFKVTHKTSFERTNVRYEIAKMFLKTEYKDFFNNKFNILDKKI